MYPAINIYNEIVRVMVLKLAHQANASTFKWQKTGFDSFFNILLENHNAENFPIGNEGSSHYVSRFVVLYSPDEFAHIKYFVHY